MNPKSLIILMPVFNDWQACNLLLERISQNSSTISSDIEVVIVNDNSTDPVKLDSHEGLNVRVIQLMRNVGHQKAIAIGLSQLATENGGKDVLVMDSDGEDTVEGIPLLLKKSTEKPGEIIFARRSKRSEQLLFKIFYAIYKSVFKLLTGRVINFGNFSLIPAESLEKVCFVSEIWNNYPGGIIRSRLLYNSVDIERGNRLAGESKMNFINLVMHGLSAIAVFLDSTAVRIFVVTTFLMLFSFSGIALVMTLKLVLHMATPGWASSLASIFLIIALQAFLISLFLVFTVLSYRMNKHFIPLIDFKPFIKSIETI